MADEPAKSPSDEELMRRTQAGDKFAFSALYDRYSTPVLDYLRRMLGNEEDVETLGQDVFRHAFRFAWTYCPPQKVSTWLFTITRNVTINRRRRAPSPEGQAETLTEPNAEWANVIRIATSDFESPMDVARVLRAVDHLTDEQKEVIVLGVFQGMSYAHMEAFTQTPAETLRARMVEGLRKLASLLNSEGPA